MKVLAALGRAVVKFVAVFLRALDRR